LFFKFFSFPPNFPKFSKIQTDSYSLQLNKLIDILLPSAMKIPTSLSSSIENCSQMRGNKNSPTFELLNGLTTLEIQPQKTKKNGMKSPETKRSACSTFV